jgi:exoribonuclease R
MITVEQWDMPKLTRGVLNKIIGKCGDLAAEQAALLAHHSLNVWGKFNKETLNPPTITYPFVKGYAFNIDPPGCQDIDDVFMIGEDGYYYIIIADVASWISLNPTIFAKASIVGQTLYTNGKVSAPLLPFEEECSLLPNQIRQGVALKFKWDGTKIYDTSFEKVSFKNNASFTYENAYTTGYSKLLIDLTRYLSGIDIYNPHNWIEQLMIFYNCEAAKVLVQKQAGILRSQLEPDIEKLEWYKSLGVDLEFLANKSAVYTDTSTNRKHWGLQKDYYCHATSPIRRFADIINQMVLCDQIPFEHSIDILNNRSTISKKYERDMFFLEQVLSSNRRIIEGIVLSDNRVWVPRWKRIVTCKNYFEPGTSGKLIYSVDMNQSTWKRKMVFRFEDINYQG